MNTDIVTEAAHAYFWLKKTVTMYHHQTRLLGAVAC